MFNRFCAKGIIHEITPPYYLSQMEKLKGKIEPYKK